MPSTALVKRQPPDGAFVTVWQGGKLLLVADARGQKRLSLPGGVIELGETPEEGAARELWEETSRKVRSIRRLGSFWSLKSFSWLHLMDASVAPDDRPCRCGAICTCLVDLDQVEVTEMGFMDLEDERVWSRIYPGQQKLIRWSRFGRLYLNGHGPFRGLFSEPPHLVPASAG